MKEMEIVEVAKEKEEEEQMGMEQFPDEYQWRKKCITKEVH